MIIGIFDSGIGGLSVYNAVRIALPNETFIFKNDSVNVPYGNKNKDELLRLIKPIFDEFIKENCQIIVIACNTVSTTLINDLRSIYNVPLLGVEPMVQEAVQLTKNKIIAVCATPTTLGSDRYSWLKKTYADKIKIIEPDCSDWSFMIEKNKIDHQQINQRINYVLNEQADVIVLGCTHYHWIEEQIKELSKNKAVVIQPEQKIIKQLKLTIKQLF